MSPSLVSIIIPCYNGASFVGEAIESALGQTYRSVEVIVVNDGSTDDSLGVIESFGDRIRYATGPNRGGGAARNRGLAMAGGDFIQFLDADDVLYATKLERMLPLAMALGRHETPACDWHHVSHPGAEPERRQPSLRPDGGVIACLRGSLPTPSPLHRIDRLRAVGGFDERLPCSQERDLHLRLACLGQRFIHIPEVLYSVRRRAGSVSDGAERVLEQHGRIFDRAMMLLEERGELSTALIEAFAEAHSRDARSAVRLARMDLGRMLSKRAYALSRSGSAAAFGRRSTRLFARLLGPFATEWMCQWIVRRVA